MNKKEIKREYYYKYISLQCDIYIPIYNIEERKQCDNCKEKRIKNEKYFVYYSDNYILNVLCFGCYMKRLIKSF